mgnify:CR=1 FL=1
MCRASVEYRYPNSKPFQRYVPYLSYPELRLNNKFDLKYELCILPVVENFWNKNLALTIMDGDFISVYPDTLGNLTFSSVKYTPYKKYNDHQSFIKDYLNV